MMSYRVPLHCHLKMTSAHSFQGSSDAYSGAEYADCQLPDLSDIHMTFELSQWLLACTGAAVVILVPPSCPPVATEQQWTMQQQAATNVRRST